MQINVPNQLKYLEWIQLKPRVKGQWDRKRNLEQMNGNNKLLNCVSTYWSEGGNKNVPRSICIFIAVDHNIEVTCNAYFEVEGIKNFCAALWYRQNKFKSYTSRRLSSESSDHLKSHASGLKRSPFQGHTVVWSLGSKKVLSRDSIGK